MAVGDFLKDDLGVNLPGIGGGGFNFLSLLSGVIVFAIIAAIFGAFAWWWATRRAYNKTIHKFEEINGEASPAGIDKAKEVILPFTSIRAFFLRGARVYLPRPSLQTGKGHYWYWIRDDGEWMNIRPSNINKDLKQLNIKYDHTDMRMSNAALKKLVEKNYKKLNWLKEYAPYIAMGILILMLGIVGFLIFGEAGKIMGGLAQVSRELAEVTNAVGDLLQGADNIASGSGLRSAT